MADMNLLVALVSMAIPGLAEVEGGGVRIQANVRSSEYHWKVTNSGDTPIVRFEIQQHRGYNFIVPQGWEAEHDTRTFRAWASDPTYAIRQNQTCKFSQRVSSSGGVLGSVRATVTLEDGRSVVLSNVWGPAVEPRRTVLLVPALVVLIALAQAALAARGDRRAAR
jgi:hypothetical protein